LKKILILTAGFGEGEDVAAWNVREAVEHLAPKEARIEVLDLLDSCYGRFHDLLRHTFQTAINSAPRLWHGFYQLLGHSQFVEGQIDGLTRLRNTLRDVLRSMEPDVVVSTCPIYSFLIDEIYRDGRVRDFTLISLVTDAVVKDSPWARTRCDYFAVANEAAARVLAAAGVPEKKIEIFGFPVQFRAKGRREKEIALPDLTAKGRPRILYLINSARKKSPKLLDRLLEHPDWDVTVCVGRDTGLDEMARAKAATAPERMEVIGHLGAKGRMLQLLREHHIIISKAEAGIVQEAIAARCPLIIHKLGSGQEEGNFSLLREANAGVLAEKPKEVIEWLERAFRDEGRLLSLWRKNLEPLGKPDSALNLARFILEQAATAAVPVPKLRALPAPDAGDAHSSKNGKSIKLRHLPKKLLLCDLHTHTTWSDGKLTVPEMVDFYGQRGFDCLCITDHLCDPKRLLGKLVNLTGMVIPPGEVEAYFEEIEREKKRAWAKYDLMLMTGIEFNKDGYTARTSTHLLGVDLKQPIDPSLDIKQLIAEIHAQGGLAVASHPHEMKSEWGKDTLYLWEHVDEYAPLIDAWEVANRDDIFNPVGLKKLPFIANSDFHKPKHIHSWKTLLYCEKEAEAIKHCIRVNRDVSITLYRDHRFGLEERHLHLAALENGPELVEFEAPRLTATRG
jgi:UDP-N-acetylglucosamine:LPS N-acetylglucosamine transferase/predicted metal-dependent phosphoesterase TrpH